jgi:diguanylate cyclase (GGDEF)-like protein/putative nucleotidyltransferase with HDIG domain
MRFHSLPKSSQNIILTTVVAATASAFLSIGHLIPMTGAQLLLACVVCSAMELVQIELTAEKSRMSLSFAGLLGVVMLFGPAAGAFVGVVEGASGNFVRHDPVTGKRRFGLPDMTKLTFNTFNHSLSASAAGLAFVWCGGIPGHIDQNSTGPALLATTVYFLINTWGTAAIVATTKGLEVVKVWHENFLWTAPQSLMSASSVIIGLWIYCRWQIVWIVALVLPPIYVVYYSYRLYMDKIRKDLEHISALANLNNSVIASLATAIDAKDHYTNKHLSRVQTYALAISEYLGLSAEQHEAVRCAALVHDIGKLGVPEHILTKPGKLTPDEYERMKSHVEIGAAILSPVQFPWPVVPVVMGHHERWDGLGYPQGLKGEEIPVGARVIALADVFDALTSDRPYRKAMTHKEALDYVSKQSGSHFDPLCVEGLLNVMDECEARMAALSDGEPAGLGDIVHSHKISDEVMEKIARANSEFYTFYDVTHTLRGTMSLDRSMNAVIEKIQMLVPFDTCAIFLDSETDANELKVAAVTGRYADLLFGMKIAIGEGLSGRAYQTLEKIINAPATNDVGRKVPHTETLELNSSLVVPLRANGKALGTISVYHSSYNIYTDDHARLLELIAEHAANHIYSARKLEETDQMVLSDPLTGLPNALSLNNALTRRLEESRKTHEAFALVLIDLDDFNQVNGAVGHETGDELLKEAATAMQAGVRANDLLARYAGDEFILVVPNADFDLVTQVCHRLAESVSSIRVSDHMHLGASVGFALYPDDALNARELLEIAENRMFADKNTRKQAE